jgi:hypothetical protein
MLKEYPDTYIKVLTKKHFNNRCLHSENSNPHKYQNGALERKKNTVIPLHPGVLDWTHEVQGSRLHHFALSSESEFQALAFYKEPMEMALDGCLHTQRIHSLLENPF